MDRRAIRSTKNFPSRENADAYGNRRIRSIAAELDPTRDQNTRFFSTGSVTGDDVDPAKFLRDGYVLNDNKPEHLALTVQCVFLRVLAYRAGTTAVSYATIMPR